MSNSRVEIVRGASARENIWRGLAPPLELHRNIEVWIGMNGEIGWNLAWSFWSLIIILAIFGCQPSRICSNMPSLSTVPEDTLCGCFDLEQFGGGFDGGTHRARAEGVYRAVVIRPDSTFESYLGDTLQWSSPFSVEIRQPEFLNYPTTVLIIKKFGRMVGTWAMVGRDTLVNGSEGVADGGSSTYVRSKKVR